MNATATATAQEAWESWCREEERLQDAVKAARAAVDAWDAAGPAPLTREQRMAMTEEEEERWDATVGAEIDRRHEEGAPLRWALNDAGTALTVHRRRQPQRPPQPGDVYATYSADDYAADRAARD